MLNVAVIGIGSMGKNHARIYSESDKVNLVAVSDMNEALAKEISEKYGCKYYTDYKEMISKEKLDIVSVVVPTEYHKQVAFDVIDKKINILLEKPITSTIEDGKKLVEFARNNGIKIMIGHIERFNPVVIELKKRLENNELGEIFKIDVNRSGPFPQRIGDVGVVIDLAVHDLDIIRYLTGAEITRAHAEIAKKIHKNHEDMICAVLKLSNGAICNMNVNWLTPIKIRNIQIIGEKGMYTADYITQEINFYQSDGIESTVTKISVQKKEPLLTELEHFIDCVENDKTPLVSAEDGLRVLEQAKMLIEIAGDE
ncbi:MAG: Gfo/Idh/MocA family oxidoreductase [Nanoarchaeota archaeon]|nr:Gfo/Idh/MocA family oxidoreductase [Nanoarchaeota archaeon]MBU4124202.1 Gfo/Idh/MocA family oxidoreductase [Nanoarchaeota archaeon]